MKRIGLRREIEAVPSYRRSRDEVEKGCQGTSFGSWLT
jgi:hypothetical protein